MRLAVAIVLAAAAAGCEVPEVSVDGGYVDTDADPLDLRAEVDGDVAAPEIAVACGDGADEVYTTPEGLLPMTRNDRGAVVRCARLGEVGADEVAADLAEVEGVVVESGYEEVLIAYRTERAPRVPGMATARLLLPDVPLAGPLPVVVVASGSLGLADRCAPSLLDGNPYDAPLVLPWVARGLPTVVPDYAGLGTAGVQGYSNNPDQAHSVLDAARAALRAVAPGTLDGRVVLVGHSQGGGAALAAFALEADEYAVPYVDLEAVAAFAPAISIESFTDGIRHAPMVRLDTFHGQRAIFSMMLYADFANLYGEGSALDAFAPGLRDHVGSSIQSLCIDELIPALDEAASGYVVPATLGDLIDLNFQMTATSCLDDVPGCPDAMQAFVDRYAENEVTFAPGPPVLMLGGDADTVTPLARQACVRDALEHDGVEPQVCLSAEVDHFEILGDRGPFAVEWVLAALAGEGAGVGVELPACADGPELPGCETYE
jgi:pimeloyl-ACP methyl ester carboxylesterase